MSGALKGVLVAFANTVVVAICIAVFSGESDTGKPLGLAVMIVMIAFIPATLVGGLLGHVAGRAKMNRAVLLMIMIMCSCVAVAMLGDSFRVEEFVLPACIPTAAGCSVLERWTRPDDAMPVARLA